MKLKALIMHHCHITNNLIFSHDIKSLLYCVHKQMRTVCQSYLISSDLHYSINVNNNNKGYTNNNTRVLVMPFISQKRLLNPHNTAATNVIPSSFDTPTSHQRKQNPCFHLLG